METLKLTNAEISLIRKSLTKAMLEVDNKASELFCKDRTDEEHLRLVALGIESSEYYFLLHKLRENED